MPVEIVTEEHYSVYDSSGTLQMSTTNREQAEATKVALEELEAKQQEGSAVEQ